jgi:hypothetical protein
VKPWDCVGTSEEATVALAAARAQYAAADIPEPRMLASLALPDVAAAAARLAATPDESSIPPELSGIRTTTSSLAARGFLPRGT